MDKPGYMCVLLYNAPIFQGKIRLLRRKKLTGHRVDQLRLRLRLKYFIVMIKKHEICLPCVKETIQYIQERHSKNRQQE